MPDAATAASTRTTRRAGPLRVGLLGGFGIGNFGNDASLEAMLLFMREHHPEAELTCICSNPKGLPERFNIRGIPTVIAPRGALGALNKLLLRAPGAIASWIYSLWVLGRFDVIVVAGTGVFDDYRDTPLGWPSRTLRWSLASRLRGVRYAYVSVGAGPLVNPVSRWLMKQAAKIAAYRSYRDDDSHRFMKSIGVDHPSDTVLPDLAFLLPRKAGAPRPPGPFTIGVGVMTYGGWHETEAGHKSYLDLHERLIRWIEGQGHKVKAVIGQSPADLKAIDALEARLGKPLLSAEERGMSSIHDAMDAIAETDFVVASRYHVQIAALKMRRPLISLGYGPKNDALMQAAGLDAFIHNVDATDFDALTQQIETIAADRARYIAIVDERVSGMERDLRQALRKLDFLN